MGKNCKNKSKHNNKNRVIKRTVKFLACAPGPKIQRLIIKQAPDEVIKAISNAALNVREGDIALTPANRALFTTQHRIFDRLVNSRESIESKRNLLLKQKGGAFPILVPILQSALVGLGSAFINRFLNFSSDK